MTPKPEPPPPPGERCRRPYRAPVLEEFGSIAARTLASALGSFPDAMGMNTSMMTCF